MKKINGRSALIIPLTGATARVSLAVDGVTQGDGSSNGASISDDGQYVVFDSAATNLVDGDVNGFRDMFRAPK